MKKYILSPLAAFGSFAVFAEGSGETAIDTQVATAQLARLTDAISGWFTQNWPVIIGVCGVLLLPWLVKMAIRVLKSLAAAFK